MTRVGLLGGSFNPAHRAHLRISRAALDALNLDEIWWLVSPGNPLKPTAGMAPLSARLARARAVARRNRVRVTDIEARLGTRYTVATLRRLRHRYPQHRFVWIMGADIIDEFHRWRDWRRIVRSVPIAVAVRPSYNGMAAKAPAAAWLRRFVRPLRCSDDWTMWTAPAIVLLPTAPDRTSATALRRAEPDWHHRYPPNPSRPRPRFP